MRLDMYYIYDGIHHKRDYSTPQLDPFKLLCCIEVSPFDSKLKVLPVKLVQPTNEMLCKECNEKSYRQSLLNSVTEN